MHAIPQHEREKLLQQIDTLIRDLQHLRAQLGAPFSPTPSKVSDLFGKLGRGCWQEYDLDMEWERFTR